MVEEDLKNDILEFLIVDVLILRDGMLQEFNEWDIASHGFKEQVDPLLEESFAIAFEN